MHVSTFKMTRHIDVAHGDGHCVLILLGFFVEKLE